MNQAKRKGPNPRRLALRVLREVEQREGFSNRLLSAKLDAHPELDPRDRAFITTLVYGVLRNRARLDKLIDSFATKPKKLKGELRMIMRLATFEIVELERPLAIANSEAAKLAQRIDPRGRLAGMITAILHMVDRDWPIMDVALMDGDPVDALTLRWSLPRWLAQRWVDQLGVEGALARARALSSPPTVDLRVDLHRSDPAAVRAALLEEQPKIRFVDLPESAGDQAQCLRARGGGDIFYGPCFEAGMFSIQSLGSQQVVRHLAPQAGERVLDACAGMGTKTVQIAELMARKGSLWAIDPSTERLVQLQAQRARCKLDGAELELEVVAGDLREFSIEGSFDAVLVDAPCTGLGNLGRHPELRWTCALEDIETCAQLQAQLLASAAAHLRPGGRLVYAVCSLEPEEGPQLIEAFLSQHPEFELVASEAWTPESHQTDGMWMAHLRRQLAHGLQ